MEKIESVYFNGDFEEQIETSKVQFNFSKKNQELEYLLFWVQNLPLLSQKKYSQKYLEFVKKVSGNNVKLTTKTENCLYWWGDVLNLERSKKLNDKFFSFNLARELKIEIPDSKIQVIDREEQLEEKYLYKTRYSMSGKGILTYLKMKDLLKTKKNIEVISMPKLDRQQDFSYLNYRGGMTYENIVDSHFQYKGTLLGTETEITKNKNWKLAINRCQEVLGDGVWSIDAFSYVEKSQKKYCYISEINYRKTMGYITCLLREKFSSSFKLSKLVMSKTSKLVNTFFESEEGGYIALSPEDTYFKLYFVFANDLRTLENLEINCLESH